MDSPCKTLTLSLFSPSFHVTEFRKDPTYSIPYNWFRFISLGILPFVLLVFFNLQIYVDIR